MKELKVMLLANDGYFIGAFINWCDDEVLLHLAYG